MDGFIAMSDIITNERESPMIIRDIADCPRNRVIDGSLLAELLHPDKVPGAQRLRCSIAHAIVPPGEIDPPPRPEDLNGTLLYP